MDDLWRKWRALYNARGITADQICVDGIVDPSRFADAPKRVLFVLRDVNQWPGGDLRTLIAAGPKYQLWHTVGRWAAGLLSDFPDYEEVDRYDRMRDALRQIAVINLKKTSGGPQANMGIVNAFAAHDRELLVEQVERISPEIILACGTFDQLIWLLNLEINPEDPWSGLARDPARGIRVASCRHPVRCDNRKAYAELRSRFSTSLAA